MSVTGIDNEFGIDASWNSRELTRSNDGKNHWTESYRARYISTADIAAAQDAALNRAGSESLRMSDQARGDFAALLRASNGTQIELPYRQQDKPMQGSDESGIRSTIIGMPRSKPEFSAQQAPKVVSDQKVSKPGRKTLKLHAPKRPETLGLTQSHGRATASATPLDGRVQPKQVARTGATERLNRDTSQRTDDDMLIRASKEGEDDHSNLERHDSLVPKSESSESIDSPHAQNSTQASTLPTVVVTPVKTAQDETIQTIEDRSTRGSRKRRGNDLTIYGTPSLGSMKAGKKEMWYLATDGKNYLLQGDEDPAWILKTFEVERGAPFALPNKRSTPARNSSPAQTLRGRSTSRRRAV
ncbi:hypothetical protein K431DRAFT_109884 [Polychaeton citri CBS 116435]|uniref:Uncharacterized protein n=1 Tax=Polychaeton citri CBS 116435 TaxID=1314669 RepID=A0A9P4UNK3_9PEZI|nr:hypothetical protein K431DRAFT_109884 [Polychaeton citri CBS 116435]